MVKKFFNKIANRTRFGFLTAFLLLLISYVLTFVSTQKVIEQANGINHTNRVIHDLDNILSFIIKGESSFRGYIISDNRLFLTEYDRSIMDTDSTLILLKEMTVGNAIHQEEIDSLQLLIEDKFLWIEDLFSQYTITHTVTPSLIQRINEGAGKMEKIEKQVVEMQSSERQLWEKRSQQISQYSNFIKIFNIASFIIALLLTLFSLIVYNKENKAKKEQENKTFVFRDQLEKRVEQLAELNKELIELRSLEKYGVTGRIARTIAHEVRNPLTNINLSIEQLRTEVENTETTKMFFDMVTRNSDRINALLSDLLNSTRIAELNMEEVNVNKVIEESLELAKDRIELKHIKVVKKYDPDPCIISVDVDKIRIAFLNIIVNAIEAMDPQGRLTIATHNRNNKCVVSVQDTGIGMSKEQVDRLFEPYFTTKEKGNGLGLANAQNIIIGHGGSITGESEQGKGTTFTITFKLTPNP